MAPHIQRVAVAQLGGNLFDCAGTLAKVEVFCREAGKKGVRLIVFPEATLGGYPKGITFGTAVGMRTDAGREWFRRYYHGAIDVPGSETKRLQQLSDDENLVIVIGVIERDGGTLYIAQF